MKNTFGKLGIGLAGAVACAGLLSAGVQTANAQIVLTSVSPVITEPTFGNYLYTYTIQFGDTGNIMSSGAYVQLGIIPGALGGNPTIPSINVSNGGVSADGSFASPVVTSSGAYTFYKWSFTSNTNYTSNNTDGLVIGTITLTSNTNNEIIPTLQQKDGNFQSDLPADAVGGFVGTNTPIPDINGTPLAPLSLPVAVWPGLLTLVGMAVIGGLRLRRRVI